MRKPLPSKTAVLELLEREGRALSVQEIAQRLDVHAVAHDGLLRLLDNLVFEGIVSSAGGQKFKVEGNAKRGRQREQREGILTVNPRGFGFVASPTASGDDVFIPAESLGAAMHGDKVVIDIVARGQRGAEGRIVEIKQRGSARVSGVLRRRGKSAWVEPDDPRVRGPVVLTREIDLAGPEGNSGQDGDVVVIEITRYPEVTDENPEGKLLAVLGKPGELGVEVKKVLFLQKVEELHSPEAVAEAEAYGVEVPSEMLEGREDLTHVPLPTIDPDDARDHDDAVWVARTERGGYEVWVAIADVSSYVRPGTKIDEEARTRGCSIYLPDRAIPMLPRALSSNLCSLLPDVIRLCLCVHAELDAHGSVIKTRLVRGYMKSQAKLTYGGVARALGLSTEPPVQPKAEEMIDGLRVAQELSRILRGKRMKRGALDFDLPEAVVVLAQDGSPKDIKRRAQDLGVKKAYQLIEELMIFANEVVARWLIEHQLPGIFRVHLPPDPKKLDRLAAMCEMLGVEFDPEDTQTPKALSELLKKFAGHPLSSVLNNLLLRSMKQASYDVANLGHFGLASDAYLHFTSPIRRYPDLVVHRVVHAALSSEGKKAVSKVASPEAMTEAALASSMAERRAMEIEREIVDIYRVFFMIDRVGERYEGTIGAFVGSGAFVTLDDPFVDVLVRVEDMGSDFVIADDGLRATSKRSGAMMSLGDRLVVEISDCAILRRTIYGRLEGGGARASSDDRRDRPRVKASRFEARGRPDGARAGGGGGPGGGARGGGEQRGSGGPKPGKPGKPGKAFGKPGKAFGKPAHGKGPAKGKGKPGGKKRR